MMRTCNNISPEAIFKVLEFGRGFLILIEDEMAGFAKKHLVDGTLKSFLCTAFSGKDLSYTTVKHGAIRIEKSSISLIGSIQPGPLIELLSQPDEQSFYDRFVMIAASEVCNRVQFKCNIHSIIRFNILGF